MNIRILEILACPRCRHDLKLEVFKQTSGRGIDDGLLQCSACGEWYPIIDGVPRMVVSELKEPLFELYPHFFRANHDVLSARGVPTAQNAPASTVSKTVKTMSMFAYEWKEFDDYDNDNFFYWMPSNITPAFFKGKFGLEVGCGAGRHTERASSYGAEMVAIDLSDAVDVAFRRNSGNDKVHVIQADLYALPFKNNVFDFIYCLGVIQHLTDPPQAVSKLVPHLKNGGALVVNVYSNERKALHLFLDGVRQVTRRLPFRAVKFMSLCTAMLDYGLLIWPYSVVTKIPVLRSIAERVTWSRTKVYSQRSFKVCVADWFDRLAAPIITRYGKNDVHEWLTTNRLSHVAVDGINRAFWAGYGCATEEDR
jgi:uncharacterized protein YbaR (Trm112 family)/SAM-dependent methyltransferase